MRGCVVPGQRGCGVKARGCLRSHEAVLGAAGRSRQVGESEPRVLAPGAGGGGLAAPPRPGFAQASITPAQPCAPPPRLTWAREVEAGVAALQAAEHPGRAWSGQQPLPAARPAAQRAVALSTGVAGTVSQRVVPEPAVARGGGGGAKCQRRWAPSQLRSLSPSSGSTPSGELRWRRVGPARGSWAGAPTKVPSLPPEKAQSNQGLWSPYASGDPPRTRERAHPGALARARILRAALPQWLQALHDIADEAVSPLRPTPPPRALSLSWALPFCPLLPGWSRNPRRWDRGRPKPSGREPRLLRVLLRSALRPCRAQHRRWGQSVGSRRQHQARPDNGLCLGSPRPGRLPDTVLAMVLVAAGAAKAEEARAAAGAAVG